MKFTSTLVVTLLFVTLLVIIPLFPGATEGQQNNFKIINLRYRFAEDIIPLLQPMLDGQTALTGQGDRLIVRASPGEMEKIRELIWQLDIPRRQLLLTVQQVDSKYGTGERVELSGSAAIGFRGRSTDYSRRQNHTRILGSTQSREAVTQQLQVVDGAEAYIQLGQEVRRVEDFYLGDGIYRGRDGEFIGSIGADIYYEPVETGFFVRPQVTGDQVTLAISSNRERLREEDSNIEFQNLSTVVSGNLGEWIQVGVSTEGRKREDRGVVYYGQDTSRRRSQSQVLIKVEMLP